MTGKDLSKKCELCQDVDWRYRCPGCKVRTCSLPCVRQHKVNTGCTGQRDKTAYMPVKQFTDLDLLNDYRFLEDAGRQNNNATRDVLKRKHFRPGFLKELEKQAGIRKIDLRLMPYPMSRRKNNYTTYQHKSKSILWQLEWHFPQADTVLTDKRIPETSTLESVLDRHVGSDADPILRHKLRSYIQAGTLKWAVYLPVEECPGGKRRFHRLDMSKTVTENLAHKCVIEYPSLYVVLEPHWTEYNTDTSNEQGLPGKCDSLDIEGRNITGHTEHVTEKGIPGDETVKLSEGTSDSDADSSDSDDAPHEVLDNGSVILPLVDSSTGKTQLDKSAVDIIAK